MTLHEKNIMDLVLSDLIKYLGEKLEFGIFRDDIEDSIQEIYQVMRNELLSEYTLKEWGIFNIIDFLNALLENDYLDLE